MLRARSSQLDTDFYGVVNLPREEVGCASDVATLTRTENIVHKAELLMYSIDEIHHN